LQEVERIRARGIVKWTPRRRPLLVFHAGDLFGYCHINELIERHTLGSGYSFGAYSHRRHQAQRKLISDGF
jgi:hypothetical protein